MLGFLAGAIPSGPKVLAATYPTGVAEVTVRLARRGDGAHIARIHRDSAFYYVSTAPDLFRMPDEDGVVEWLEDDLAAPQPDPVALVAEVAGEVAGHLEAQLLPPLDS